jgi:hypothetical protein
LDDDGNYDHSLLSNTSLKRARSSARAIDDAVLGVLSRNSLPARSELLNALGYYLIVEDHPMDPEKPLKITIKLYKLQDAESIELGD